MNKLKKTIEKKYGVTLPQKNDAEIYRLCKKIGLPSLAKLLKITV